jgi:hypothetical protein
MSIIGNPIGFEKSNDWQMKCGVPELQIIIQNLKISIVS